MTKLRVAILLPAQILINPFKNLVGFCHMHVIVEAPGSLRRRVAEEAAAIASRYATKV